MSVKIKTELTIYLITSQALTYATGLANQHVITTFTPEPELWQGTNVNSNKWLHYQYLKYDIKVLSNVQ
jgi:hypothetical protein